MPEKKIHDLIPKSHLDLFEPTCRAFAFLGTLMKDGSPQVTPVWFNTDDQYILVNTAVGRTKDRNMQARPVVAIAIFDPANPYRYIQIRGKVVERTEEGGREHIDALSKKYTGRERYNSMRPGEVRVIFKISLDHITAIG